MDKLKSLGAKLFSKPADPKELVRKWQNTCRGEGRAIDRQIRGSHTALPPNPIECASALSLRGLWETTEPLTWRSNNVCDRQGCRRRPTRAENNGGAGKGQRGWNEGPCCGSPCCSQGVCRHEDGVVVLRKPYAVHLSSREEPTSRLELHDWGLAQRSSESRRRSRSRLGSAPSGATRHPPRYARVAPRSDFDL
jgi:hypothetical protein